MKSQSYLGFDVILFIAVLSLICIGILFIYSSGITSTGDNVSNEYIKQIFSALVGIIILLFVAFSNYNRLKDYALYAYLFFLLLLVFTLFFGKKVNGARSWISIGPLHIGQPSEFMKIITILMLASFLDNNQNTIQTLRTLVKAAFLVFIPFCLILLQPDMGTALVFLPIFYSMTFISGAKTRYLLFSIFIGFITITLGLLPIWESHFYDGSFWLSRILSNTKLFWAVYGAVLLIELISIIGYFVYKHRYYYWISYCVSIFAISLPLSNLISKFLKDYQIMRFMVFLDPYVDPKGTGWNIIQSMTAVGSGGIFGKGFLKGTQSHYRFLPQQSTDFIFSILAEEWGFAGCMITLLLFAIILYRGFRIMLNAKDFFGMAVAVGIVSIIFFHLIINIGMAIGIMPITGIPLMFLSYGGSSLWTGLIGIGLLLNIYLRKYRY